MQNVLLSVLNAYRELITFISYLKTFHLDWSGIIACFPDEKDIVIGWNQLLLSFQDDAIMVLLNYIGYRH